jgi:hypothetical protein
MSRRGRWVVLLNQVGQKDEPHPIERALGRPDAYRRSPMIMESA